MTIPPDTLKQAREAKGLTQEQLGKMLDPPAAGKTVHHWEHGDYRPKSPRREQLMRILDITPERHTTLYMADLPTGNINMTRHELIEALLHIRSEVDRIVSRV